MKKVRKRRAYAFYWWDIEASPGWGTDGKDLPVCVTLGFIQAKPNPKDKIPFWRIMGSWVEEEPGGETKIPEMMVKRRVPLGFVEIPWR